ncbi:uncharacterized protein LOC143448234 [Clavelina lepadiformis]|uniref:uncharacterized protein LOC143448234 n=1 Tax=Clavelina lepadiformis TaxID=159417 RepID=UPI004041DA4E
METTRRTFLFTCCILYVMGIVQPQDIFGYPDHSKMLMQRLAILMVSDYNIISTSNSQLYTITYGHNSFQCKNADQSQCRLTLVLMPTNCKRTTSWLQQPIKTSGQCTVIDGESKTCSGEVDLNRGVISAPLKCKGEENDLGSLIAQLETNENIPNPKKKYRGWGWRQSDGNPHPWK